MSPAIKSLADDDARRTAIAVHNRSFLVEAGAGSGKTAVMAGRIVMLMAAGVRPKNVAAVTFTELAASELVVRVREFVSGLVAGDIPAELRIALPHGLAEDQGRHLSEAAASIDEMACSTIHSLCQRLITPYPVEANIDPGARVMDRDQADLAFREIADTWLRTILSEDSGGLVAEMVIKNPDATVELIHRVLARLRNNRSLIVDAPASVVPAVAAFRHAAEGLASFIQGASAIEAETADIARQFSAMAADPALANPANTPGFLLGVLAGAPHPDLCTAKGTFKAYKRKTKWGETAKRAGLSKADGERLNSLAEDHYNDCCTTWTGLLETAAASVLADLVDMLRSVVDTFRSYKRSAALLDFDDLIHAARDLLRDHDTVRRALAARYTHVLVDEVQDTDPLQTEIFWRLCGEPPDEAANDDWTRYRIRPGALFLVGDPKQAIYRFRGADVAAYLEARSKFHAEDSDSILNISTNFRSRAPILRYVNERFEGPLSTEQGQPGFTQLDPFQKNDGDETGVVALPITIAGEDGKASAEQQRDGEAEAIADMCARLIDSWEIQDRKSGKRRLCRPGDIALLAPTGKDMWRYEEALERRGIPVATQAGKGLFRRQEVQDMIALSRVLADRRDTLALGALLRGPVVGLTEEELLDIVWELPRREEKPDALARLDLGVEPSTIRNQHARDVILKLQGLRRRVNSTTPHELLSQAVDVLRLKAILLQRHRGQAERALANVDLYLSLSKAFSVRGLRAFAEAMSAAWTDEARAVEGRPDAQEEAVALYTMHAAKGLEWPIVVPINTMTAIMSPESAVTDRVTGHLYCPVFKVNPTGYEMARDAEKAEFDRERIRLWYVATTRARDLLVLPRLDVTAKKGTWISLLDLSLSDLPVLDIAHLPSAVATGPAAAENSQTREVFADEAALITARHRKLLWLTPSRDEGGASPVIQTESFMISLSDADASTAEDQGPEPIQGSRERGLILHKIMEEVLSGETGEASAELRARAYTLIRALVPIRPRPQGNSGQAALACSAAAGLPQFHGNSSWRRDAG